PQRPFPQRGRAAVPARSTHGRLPGIAWRDRAVLLSGRFLPLRGARRTSPIPGGRYASVGDRRADRHRLAGGGIASLSGDVGGGITTSIMSREDAMQRVGIIIVALVAIAIGRLAAAQPAGQQLVMLNLVTAGDQNMVDYVKDYLGPMFEKEHPGVTVRAVGTGPGDAGSQKIYEKLEAKKTNSSWDIDVAVIHQKAAGEMVTKGLLTRYVAEVPTAKLVTSEAAKRALGADVEGYVMPMFNSQTAIAYNAMMVRD